MAYYLHHYFTPDFNHKRLAPKSMIDGNVNTQYLGYVQNVVAGQVLAELKELSAEELTQALTGAPTADNASGDSFLDNFSEDLLDGQPLEKKYDARYIYNDPVFPVGPNCGPAPDNPNRIIALCNGYCFYNDGLITVKKLLNVRSNINFHTGNVLFAGDVVVHGDVYPGFSLCGGDLLIKGRVDGGQIKARGRIVCENGVKGAPTALLQAGSTIRLSFCEGARIETEGNLIIDGNCMHSELYVGGSLVIKGRLQGGTTYAKGLVYARQQIGDNQGAVTRIILGYDPISYAQLQLLESAIKVQSDKVRYYIQRSAVDELFEDLSAPQLELARHKLAALKEDREKLWQGFTLDSDHAKQCRIIAPGTVYPGCEISIGTAFHKVVDPYKNCYFILRNDDIEYNTPASSRPELYIP